MKFFSSYHRLPAQLRTKIVLFLAGYNITLDPDGKVQVKDSKWAIINCVVTFDEGVDANKSEFNVTWMDENGEPVKVGGRDGDFQVADSNSAQNEKRIVLNVTGEGDFLFILNFVTTFYRSEIPLCSNPPNAVILAISTMRKLAQCLVAYLSSHHHKAIKVL